jgi:hypothetical protein
VVSCAGWAVGLVGQLTLFALLPDGSLLLRALDVAPSGSDIGLKLCNVAGTLGIVDSTGTFTPLA